MKVKINTRLLPLKGFFFFFWGANACVLIYMPLLAKQIGLSITETGIIWGIFPILSLLGKPLIGGIADKYRRHKFVFLVVLLLQTAFTFIVYLIPSFNHPSNNLGTISCLNDQLSFHSCLSRNKECIKEGLSPSCNLTCHFTNMSHAIKFCEYIGLQNICRQSIPSDPSNDLELNVSMALSRIVLNSRRCIHSPITTFLIDSSVSSFKNCKNFTQIECSTECASEIFDCNDDNTTSINKMSNNDFHTVQFWVFLITQIVAKLGFSSSIILADAITFDTIKDTSQSYGHQRFLGSVGFAIVALSVGELINRFSIGKPEVDYGPGFYTYGILMIVTVVVTGYMKVSSTLKSPDLLKDVSKLFVNITIVVFILVVCVTGMCTGFIYTFHSWYMHDMGANSMIIGLASFIGCVSEIPFFFFASKIIKKLDHANTMYLVLFCLALRLGLISIVPNKWLFLPIEVLHGITFGLFYANMALYGMKIAPPGTMATTQGILGATFEGVGMGLGSLFGGFIKERWGAVITFRCFSIGALITGFLFFFFNICLQRLWQERQHYKPSGPKRTAENSEGVKEEMKMIRSNFLPDDSTGSSNIKRNKHNDSNQSESELETFKTENHASKWS